jgi:hypothetical protein
MVFAVSAQNSQRTYTWYFMSVKPPVTLSDFVDSLQERGQSAARRLVH